MPSITTTTDDFIVFTNDDAIYKIAPYGNSTYLAALDDGQELWVSKESSTFAFLRLRTENGQETLHSTGATYSPLNGQEEEGILQIRFPGPYLMIISCRAEPDHFLFTLKDVVNTGIVPGPVPVVVSAMVQIILQGDAYGGMMGAVRKENHLVAEVVLNPETHIHSTRISNDEDRYAMLTTGFEAIKPLGGQMALVVCPQDQWLTRLQDLEVRYDLPRHTIDGIRDQEHPDVKAPYLFLDLTLDNHAEVIRYAKLGGFKHVMPYRWTWTDEIGTYSISPANYGGDIENLKLVSNRLRGHGMKLGLHVMAFMVGKLDPLISSPWVKKLAKQAPVELAEDKGMELALNVVPDDLPEVLERYRNYFKEEEFFLLINEEIVKAVSIQEELGNGDSRPGFIVAQRGALGTNSSSHSSGTRVYHLIEFFNTFLADPATDLTDEIARNFAQVFDETRAGLAFLDGAEGTKLLLPDDAPWADGWTWYAITQVAQKFRQHLRRDVLLQSSGADENLGYAWHLYTRGTSGDYATYSTEDFMDNYRIGRFYDDVYHEVRHPQELGWIGLLTRVEHRRALNASFRATTVDEMEYKMNRSLGLDVPISLESDLEELRENGHTNDIMRLIGNYEHLRQSYQLPEALLEKLRRPDSEIIQTNDFLKEQYHLTSIVHHPQGDYCSFRRQVYLEKVMAPGEQWAFNNPLQEQPLQLKITALPGHRSFGNSENILLFDQLDQSFTKLTAGTPIRNFTSFQIEEEAITVPEVTDPDDRTNYDERYLPRFKYCGFRKEFDSPLNLSQHKVIAFFAEGDGKEEVVSIQLTDKDRNQRLYQFTVDFAGPPRFFLFPLPASAAEFYRYPPSFGGRVLRWFNWSRITAVEIYVKNIPSTGIRVKIHSMKALKQDYPLLRNPSIELGGRHIEFPALLNPIDGNLAAEPWDYLVFNGQTFDRFDGNNQFQENGIHDVIIRSEPPELPVVANGTNRLTFRQEGSSKALVRILLESRSKKWKLYPRPVK